jgi:hypothetical protein
MKGTKLIKKNFFEAFDLEYSLFFLHFDSFFQHSSQISVM